MKSTQVLVVGAGPAGLLAALCLRRQGLEPVVVDRHYPSDGGGFAVVLHPSTVSLLAGLGITEPLLWHGHSFKRVALYAEGERQALLDLLAPNGSAEGGLTLPQSVLRGALERALRADGIEIRYGHRLLSLEQSEQQVHATLEYSPEPGRSAPAHSARSTLLAKFVIGADGHDSSVRAALRIPMSAPTPLESYAFFDVPAQVTVGLDVELALGEHPSGVYPLHGGVRRYAFQLPEGVSARPDVQMLREFRDLRMPWHALLPTEIEWAGSHQFQSAVAECFGHGRSWLAGDAGHTAGPLGAQSLNVGLREAQALAHQIVECLKGAPLERLRTGYDAERRREWRRLLGRDAPSLSVRAPAWARRNVPQLLRCLPASGDELDDLLEQLGITLP